MGRSRGGLTTKIHALVDADGRPIALKLTEGQAHDGRSADDMLETVREGTILLADRAYDSDERREILAERGAWANIKPLSNSAPTFIASATSSSASSTSSSTSAPWPRATTSELTISSPQSNSPLCGFGFAPNESMA